MKTIHFGVPLFLETPILFILLSLTIVGRSAQGIQPKRLKVIGEGLPLTKRKQITARESSKRWEGAKLEVKLFVGPVPQKDAGPTWQICGKTLYSLLPICQGRKTPKAQGQSILPCTRHQKQHVPLWSLMNLWHWQYPPETCGVHESDWRYFTACMLHPESALGWITGDNAQWSFLPGWDGSKSIEFKVHFDSETTVSRFSFIDCSVFQVLGTKRMYP